MHNLNSMAITLIDNIYTFFQALINAVITAPPRALLKSHNSDTTSTAGVVPFDTVLQTRRTANNFEPNLPQNIEDIIETAIKSAIYAPNHKRTEPWKFHRLGPQTIKRVCELNAKIVSEKKGEKAGQRKLERWLEMPGWIVVTCKTEHGDKEVKSMDVPSSLAREDYAACCCAVQNLCLSLHNAGLGSKWGTGAVNFDSNFHDILGFEEGEYCVGTIWFGTPTRNTEAPPKKRSVEKVMVRHD
jgi:nitroreductase